MDNFIINLNASAIIFYAFMQSAQAPGRRVADYGSRAASAKAMEAGVMADAASPPAQETSDAYPVGA